jgi:hypothetical protein
MISPLAFFRPVCSDHQKMNDDQTNASKLFRHSLSTISLLSDHVNGHSIVSKARRTSQSPATDLK